MAAGLVGTFLAAAAAVFAEDELYDGSVDRFYCESPRVEVVRPDRCWLFVNIEVQRRDALRVQPAAAVEELFRNLRMRMHHPPTKATLSLYTFGFDGTAPDLGTIEARARQDVSKRKEGVFLRSGRVRVGGRDGVLTEFEAAPEGPGARGAGPGPFFVSRLDLIEPEFGFALVFVFEVPKDRMKAALPAWKRILKNLKL